MLVEFDFSQFKRDFSAPGRSPVMSSKGMVATSHPLASQSAISVLKNGGNAIDAAIAAVACLCVVEPHMTGIGGDCFALVGNSKGEVFGLNGSGRAAANLDLQFYLDQGWDRIPETSAHSVTVPGAINAWQALRDRFGTKSFDELFVDAINYGENGYPVHPRVGADWKILEDKLKGDEGGTKHYLVNNQAPKTGSIHYQLALADSLRKIAKDGANAFYHGQIAEEIVTTVQQQGGYLQESDLAAATADWVDPISTIYKGYEVFEIPPNGQGITTLIMLRLFEKIGLPDNPNSLQHLHTMIECARMAYGVRNDQITDPDHMTLTVEAILSDTHISALSALYHPDRAIREINLPEPAHSDTVYLSVVDENGLSISLINSTFSGFGSGIVTPISGISLQNRGSGFVLKPGHPNCIAPSKRPLHTIIPAMARKDKNIVMSFGVMGGQYQPMGQALVLSNMLHYGMDPQTALDQPRIFWNEVGELVTENGFTPDMLDQLEAMGHRVNKDAKNVVLGGGQVISVSPDNGVKIAGSDPRKDGAAIGY